MHAYSLTHKGHDLLTHDMLALDARELGTAAQGLAHIAEFDERQLFLPAGYPSMIAYCVGRMHHCEQAAYKRIYAARTARKFPAIFPALADGRLHLTAVVLLASHLTEANADGLIAAATHKTKAQIEQMLAERFPKPDVLPWIEMPVSGPAPEERQELPVSAAQLSPGKVETHSSPLPTPCPPARIQGRTTPLSAQSFGVQFTMSRQTHEKLKRMEDLLGHSADLAAVFEKGVDVILTQLQKRKFGATDKPRPPRPREATANPRYIPKHVKRAVWMRDGGRCTFVGDNGHRCEARRHLQYDHVLPIARGGDSRLDNVRLRCPAHNQFEAECAFGSEFMRHKRIAASEARAAGIARERLAPATGG